MPSNQSKQDSALALLTKPKDEEKPSHTKGGCHLQLYKEQYKVAEFASPAQEPVDVHLHKILGKWFVYKVYHLVEFQHHVDGFVKKLRCLRSIPPDVMKRSSYTEISDFLSILDIISNDESRKEELRFAPSGGLRLSTRATRGHMMASSSLVATARANIKAPNSLNIHLSRQLSDILQYATKNIALLDAEAKKNPNDLIKKLRLGIATNPAPTTEGRPDYLAVQKRLNSVIPRERVDAEELLYLKGATYHEITSGLIDLPHWVEHHYLFMRAKKPLKIVWKFGEIAVYDAKRGKRRMMRVQSSRYAQKVQAVKAIVHADVFDGPQLKMTYVKPPPKPPSISSQSGFSTVMSMSTATTSPNSWEFHPWDMQPTKDEMIFRLEDDSLHNPKKLHARAMKAMAERLVEEVNHRVDLLNQDCLDFQRIKTCSSLVEDARVERQDSHPRPIPLEPLGNCKWLQRCEKEIRRILACSNPTIEDKKDLQVLLYAKERYEPVLLQYDKSSKGNVFPPPSQEMDNVGQANASRVIFSDAWRRLVDAEIVSSESVATLSCLIDNEQSWFIDSHYSNLMLVERCDHQPKPAKNRFVKNYFTVKENRGFFVATVVLFLLLLIGSVLFSTFVIMRYLAALKDCNTTAGFWNGALVNPGRRENSSDDYGIYLRA